MMTKDSKVSKVSLTSLGADEFWPSFFSLENSKRHKLWLYHIHFLPRICTKLCFPGIMVDALSGTPLKKTLLYEMYMRHPNHLHDQYTPWWCIYIHVPIRTHIRLCKRLHSVWTRHWWLHWGMMGYDQTTLDQASMFGMWTADQGRECSPVAVESGFFQAPHQGKPSVKGGNFPSKIGHHW